MESIGIDVQKVNSQTCVVGENAEVLEERRIQWSSRRDGRLQRSRHPQGLPRPSEVVEQGQARGQHEQSEASGCVAQGVASLVARRRCMAVVSARGGDRREVAGVVTLSLWRVIEQFLSSRILNESILRGEMSDLVRDVEQEVEGGWTRCGRHKQ